MIQSVHIARYRGIGDCAAEGLGRVNLVIGKNDCGKTAFMEAVRLVEDADNAAHLLLQLQRMRLRRGRKGDFDRFWSSVFYDFRASAGFSIFSVSNHRTQTLEVKKAELSTNELASEPALPDLWLSLIRTKSTGMIPGI